MEIERNSRIVERSQISLSKLEESYRIFREILVGDRYRSQNSRDL